MERWRHGAPAALVEDGQRWDGMGGMVGTLPYGGVDELPLKLPRDCCTELVQT
jgi:hypothetical protein